ncbi:hypothetical protein pb186bvf_006043, partial [Paramecium bursaria]
MQILQETYLFFYFANINDLSKNYYIIKSKQSKMK